jgi:biotin carboxylase
LKDILVVCPQERDVKAIRAARLEERYNVHFFGPDLDQVEEEFDPAAFIAASDELPADGVIGTKDLSALLASLIAARRGLPGPTPQALIACQHKPTSRRIQQTVAPAATPDFARLDGQPGFAYPFFVKPVVGRLSQNTHRIDNAKELGELEEVESYTSRYASIATLAGADPESVHGFLAEELLRGDEVTLEGYVHDGRVVTIGITDSIKYPGTFSFERFEYPSRLEPGCRDELCDVVNRVMPAIGFEGGFFNVEFFIPERGRAQIIEVNGRIASQFAPLVYGLHGRSTYDALFAVATGEDPGWQTGRPSRFGLSYVMRVFEDAYVEAVPEPEDNLEILVAPGRNLSEQGVNDAESFRLAILYGFGDTREEALEGCRERAEALTFRLVPAR